MNSISFFFIVANERHRYTKSDCYSDMTVYNFLSVFNTKKVHAQNVRYF